MKKLRLLALLLALVMILVPVVACNTEENPEESGEASADATENNATEAPTDKPSVPAEEGTVPMFVDGAFVGNLIRKDIADTNDTTFYNDIRNTFKKTVGKTPSIKTDFDKDIVNAPAILLGETTYEESKQIYAELENTSAIARVVGNKYVLAYSSTKAGIKLMQKVLELIQTKGANGEVIIDESWNIQLGSAEILGYDDSILGEYIELPKYNGKTFDQADIDIGHGSLLNIVEDTTLSEFNAYAQSVQNAGFTFYTENEIGENVYYTYITKAQIVTLMYFGKISEARITVDNRTKFDLPALESDNVYTAVTEPSFTAIGIGQTGYPGGMGYVYKLSDGTFFIIDGGITNEGSGGKGSWKWLFGALQELADDPENIVISGWLLTHVHNDHMGAFMDMSTKSECRDAITIKQVIYSQPADAQMINSGIEHRINWIPDSIDRWMPESVVKAHPGQTFYFAELTLTVYGSQDIVLPESIKSHNNACVVTKVNFQGKDFLMLADAEGNENRALVSRYGNELDADILQLSHHGYNNTDAGIVYDLVTSAKIILWPVSTGHYDGSGGANVANVSFNRRFFSGGYTNHIAGEDNMTIIDFTTWIPEKRWLPKV